MDIKSANGLGTQLRRLIELLDGDLELIYKQDGFGYRPRYTPIVKALIAGNSRSIKDIACMSSISHSAASQTVSKMIDSGLVESGNSDDGRERLIKLTPKARALLPLLNARWTATQNAAEKLDRELSAPLSQILDEAISALTERSFSARISQHENTKNEALK